MNRNLSPVLVLKTGWMIFADVNLGEGLETLVENVQTTPMQTPSKKTVFKRKISPKQVPKQGPAEDEPEGPSSKKAAPTTSKLA